MFNGMPVPLTFGRFHVRTYRILAVALVAILLFGCSGKYQQEKTLLTAVTKAMETLTAAVNQAGAPQELTSAVNAFSDQIEKLAPAMKKLSDEHPDWETNPPSQLKDTMEKLKSASGGLQGAMSKVMQMASQYPDDTELQGALNRFQSVVQGL